MLVQSFSNLLHISHLIMALLVCNILRHDAYVDLFCLSVQAGIWVRVSVLLFCTCVQIFSIRKANYLRTK